MNLSHPFRTVAVAAVAVVSITTYGSSRTLKNAHTSAAAAQQHPHKEAEDAGVARGSQQQRALRQAHVVFRHGSRTPVFSVRLKSLEGLDTSAFQGKCANLVMESKYLNLPHRLCLHY